VKKRGRYLEVLLCVKDNIRLSTQWLLNDCIYFRI
jgi:hypothetical protein